MEASNGIYRHASKIMCLETTREVVQARKSTPFEKNSDNNKKQKNGDRRLSLENTNKKAKAPDMKVPRPPLGKFINYTNLISSREDVFLAAGQT